MRKLPLYVSATKDRHGKTRLRFRRKGQKAYYFKAKFGTSDWQDEYRACLAGELAERIRPGEGRIRSGSVEHLIVVYYQSADFARPGERTRHKMRGIIERFRNVFGKHDVDDVNYRVASGVMALMHDRPHAANRMRKLMRRVWDEGRRLELTRNNPWALTRPFPEKGEGFHPWTDDEIATFRAHWDVGTRQRLAMELMLWLGQRGGDVRTMGPQHVRGGRVKLRQGKTGRELSLPIPAMLQRAITETPSGHLNFIVTAFGKPFSERGFGQWFGRACDAAGLGHCRAHGLRKAASRILAEAGATDREIMSVTGHKSAAEVTRYTESARQSALADHAMKKVVANPSKKLATIIDNQLKKDD